MTKVCTRCVRRTGGDALDGVCLGVAVLRQILVGLGEIEEGDDQGKPAVVRAPVARLAAAKVIKPTMATITEGKLMEPYVKDDESARSRIEEEPAEAAGV